jgi:hypothetical protein
MRMASGERTPNGERKGRERKITEPAELGELTVSGESAEPSKLTEPGEPAELIAGDKGKTNRVQADSNQVQLSTRSCVHYRAFAPKAVALQSLFALFSLKR